MENKTWSTVFQVWVNTKNSTNKDLVHVENKKQKEIVKFHLAVQQNQNQLICSSLIRQNIAYLSENYMCLSRAEHTNIQVKLETNAFSLDEDFQILFDSGQLCKYTGIHNVFVPSNYFSRFHTSTQSTMFYNMMTAVDHTQNRSKRWRITYIYKLSAHMFMNHVHVHLQYYLVLIPLTISYISPLS